MYNYTGSGDVASLVEVASLVALGRGQRGNGILGFRFLCFIGIPDGFHYLYGGRLRSASFFPI